MSENRKLNLRKIVSESVIIIVSVLFALFVNEWRTNHNDEKRISIIMDNIKQELALNRATTKDLINYYEDEVLIKLNNAITNDSLEFSFIKSGRFSILNVAPKGVIQKSYNNIAWELAKQENVSAKISFENSKHLFEAYKMQGVCEETISRIINLLTQRETHIVDNLKITVTLLQTEMIELHSQLKNLISNYDKALEILK